MEIAAIVFVCLATAALLPIVVYMLINTYAMIFEDISEYFRRRRLWKEMKKRGHSHVD